ncbi:hypothetical protein ACJX0J_028350, partial [Zea mays]
VSSSSLKKAIGFKTEVSYCDALMVLKSWITSKVPFRASMSQMWKFYTLLSEGVADAKIDIKREFMSSPSIFTPLQRPRARAISTISSIKTSKKIERLGSNGVPPRTSRLK